MRMVAVSMRMRVIVAMMGMAKSSETDDVDEESKNADYEKLVKSMQFMPFAQAMEGIEDYLYADKTVFV